ncbi:MAG: hypothetical protein CBC25_01170 [Pelagibacteraceae bacterium TMED65]|nr:MAG: hypothetical protein CBC25_01170 [Pelagibacteraceae bacterium TMED65]
MKISTAQILITGVYRTGSEYITHYLNQHTDIVASMYKINFLRFVKNRSAKTLSSYEISEILTKINERTISRYGTEIKSERIQRAAKKQNGTNVYDLYDLVMRDLYLKETNQTVWAEKNQLLWREIPEFVESMNNGKAILILRDPRSILASFKRYTNAPTPLYLEAVFNAFDCMRHAIFYQNSSISKKIYVTRYEDFVKNPSNELNKVLRKFSLEKMTVSKFQESIWFDPYGSEWFSNSSFAKNEPKKFDTKNAINRWRNNLSEHEIKMTEFICSAEMREFNYDRKFEDVNIKDLESYLSSFKDSMEKETIIGHFKHWLAKNEGIQKFPLDPLDPSTWD